MELNKNELQILESTLWETVEQIRNFRDSSDTPKVCLKVLNDHIDTLNLLHTKARDELQRVIKEERMIPA